MTDVELSELRAKVGLPQEGDKVSLEKRLKGEILLLRAHATIVSEHKGHLVVDFHPILTPVFHSNLTPLVAV